MARHARHGQNYAVYFVLILVGWDWWIVEIFSRFAMEVQRKRALVHILDHISTKKNIKLSENDDPKSTSFMMKSIFCAYTSRLRLVDCGNIFQIHHGSAKEESVSTHFTTNFNEKSIKFVISLWSAGPKHNYVDCYLWKSGEFRNFMLDYATFIVLVYKRIS